MPTADDSKDIKPEEKAKKVFTPRTINVRWHTCPDGSRRPFPKQSFDKGERDQVLSDFFGACPSLPVGSNMKSIEALLSEITAGLDIVEEGFAPDLLASAWQESMGDYIATQSTLVSISNAKATIKCLHPALRFELNKRKRNIVSLLNKRLGKGAVRYVRLIHG